MIDTTPFEVELKLVEARFLAEVDGLLKRLGSLSKEEKLILLREIDFLERLNTNGINKVVSGMSASMTKEIKSLRKLYSAEGLIVTSTLTPLTALVQEDLTLFMSQYTGYSSAIKQNVIQGVVAGTPNNVLAKQLTALTVGNLSGRDASFLMEETFSRFDGAIKADAFAGKEKIARWEYVGDYDEKNRDACRAVLDQGGTWTIDEINNGDAHPGVDFVSRGGFNCRHTWELADEQPDGTYE